MLLTPGSSSEKEDETSLFYFYPAFLLWANWIAEREKEGREGGRRIGAPEGTIVDWVVGLHESAESDDFI